MRLEELATAILFGYRWEDKLIGIDGDETTPTDTAPRRSPLREAPAFPGRPDRLARIGKADFPKLSRLAEATTRGRVLHFFANHELLAMELMALMLLKFPDAPTDFRAGIARTIREEQTHLRLYTERMRELGVDFGELPVSDYFWNAMKDMASPLQFVTQMSLTLEQANLDFSLFYRRAVEAVGDLETAAILDRVYREEIGHVRHGLSWFNRWRAEEASTDGNLESDWDAYRRLLPPPMTPRRAKGEIFAGEARRAAGFSERFIRELEVHSGSKGRPPTFWLYNPLCDAEIARGRPGYTPSAPVRRLNADLEGVLTFLARDTDVALVRELPRADWLKGLRDAGFSLPEFRAEEENTPREDPIGGFEPWGWSPESFVRFRPLRERLRASSTDESSRAPWCRTLLEAHADFGSTGLARFFSKGWSTGFLRRWLAGHEAPAALGSLADIGDEVTSFADACERARAILGSGRAAVAKAPWGTSGMQNRLILDAAELGGPRGGWIRNVIDTQTSIVIEPWLEEKIADLSLQIEVGEKSVKLLGIRRFVNGPRLDYRGTLLDSRLASLPRDALRFLHGEGGTASPLELWRQLARDLGSELRAGGYRGPAGIDALLWRDVRAGDIRAGDVRAGSTASPRLKPLVELNPRWTMGRVALALEERVRPGVAAAWILVPVRELARRGLPGDAPSAARKLGEAYPTCFDRAGRIVSGVVATTDPSRVREVLTFLVVGAAALGDPALAPTPPLKRA